ncbi:hypothetical protein F5I97DRAFT_2029040 [Phlebopus sp. FC_14]|nr:hypothetical protein F5I97DRAFT_2029040 [Phlebopus sp. FC_14]
MSFESQMNGDACEASSGPIQVKVNQRALVDKVLSRYPEEFTVFRELLQNADDARAETVEIEFQTKDYAPHSYGEPDLNAAKIFKWIVRNDGDAFGPNDWERLTKIADGNPDVQKIGAFGVGFFSVFSVTECPVIISGNYRKSMYYNADDELMVESKRCEATKWTVIEMQLKEDLSTALPKPFDLSRYLISAVTFLTNTKKVGIYFNGTLLAEIKRSREDAKKMSLPKDLKQTTPLRAMSVTSVHQITQQIDVLLTGLAYSAGSKRTPVVRNLTESQPSNPVKRATFWKKAEANGVKAEPVTPSFSTTNSSVRYSIYSAEINSHPPQEMVAGLEFATKKKPPPNFLCEAVHFTMEEHDHVMRDGDKQGGLGSVFRGAQALCSEREEDGAHGSRLFIGQSTAQTSGIAVHVSSRFIPTVERGTVDLTNGQVSKWNEELIYVGGYMARLIYERAMNAVQRTWPSEPSPLTEELRKEGLYIMRCFTFHASTPDSKVAELLKKAFFDCSKSSSFPIVSNLGIRDSKEVREPHEEFGRFMKDRPTLDRSLLPTRSTMIPDLIGRYQVTAYTFSDVIKELDGRTLTENEMIGCLTWWTTRYGSQKEFEKCKSRIWSLAKFRTSLRTPPQDIALSGIKKFVDPRGNLGMLLNPTDPLPPDTIPLTVTARLRDAEAIRNSLDWQDMTPADWIRHLTTDPGLDPAYDIRTSPRFIDRVFDVLARLWPIMSSPVKDEVVALMQDVPCIPTSQGMRKPQNAYYVDADIFEDMPVTLLDVTMYAPVLDDLGVHKYVDWDHIRPRLQGFDHFSPSRLVTYISYARHVMGEIAFMEFTQMTIFPSATGERYCLRDLYHPSVPHSLGLPRLEMSLFGQGADAALDMLREQGLQQIPSLHVIIEKASSADPVIRHAAFNYLLNHLEDVYESYKPDDFKEHAFLPCGKSRDPQFGTPEQVFTTTEWELLGFKKLHQSVRPKQAARLKVKERPSAEAIIQVLRESPPKDVRSASKWFDLLARKGGFNSEEINIISELDIVPVHQKENGTTTYKFVAPSKCFLGTPDESKRHHTQIFTFVQFGDVADRFLKTCGAKTNPDCADITNALLEDAQGYLDKAADHKRYVDDLRQVATGYHTLPKDVRIKIGQTPIFIAYRKKPRDPSVPTQADALEYILRSPEEILVGDDMESHRLFGDRIYTAPKEEVFENFYREMGSPSLSSHVTHHVNHRGPLDNKAEADNMRSLVMQRIVIFLYDQDSSRRSDASHIEWKKEGKFTVRFCKELDISKELVFEHAVTLNRTKSAAICEPAMAGIEMTPQGDYVLWMKQQRQAEGRKDWYDVAVALCRLLFKTHKTHDTLLLMTILDAQIDDLRRRGYDVDAIQRNYDEQVKAEEAKKEEVNSNQGAPQRALRQRPIFGLPEWFRQFTRKRKLGRSGEFLPGGMGKTDNLVQDAIDSCESDAHENRVINEDQEKAKGGKKLRDVRYCSAARQTDLVRCGEKTKNGILVYKTPESSAPPSAELEIFSTILLELGELFGLRADKLHIFWQENDKNAENGSELMGFNRNSAIYLNLAHYVGKHHCLPQNDHSKAATYAAWYFILAHEIAHNKAFFHDEDHEILFSSLAQSRLTCFRALLAKKAPGVK